MRPDRSACPDDMGGQKMARYVESGASAGPHLYALPFIPMVVASQV